LSILAFAILALVGGTLSIRRRKRKRFQELTNYNWKPELEATAAVDHGSYGEKQITAIQQGAIHEVPDSQLQPIELDGSYSKAI
jgi:hypothetical protein